MEKLAIKIEHVSKQYRLGAIGGGTLKGDLQSWWAHIRGKEDPNSKIGDRTDIQAGDYFLALDDINFEVKKGEAVGIIGHNGAGKSTLLKLLSRVTAPTKGKISINGRIASMLEVGTGFHPEMTGRENVYLNGAILGMTRAEIDKKFDEIVNFSEVARFIDTPVKRYSSGMYVKLAFSVAAHLDSEIMIMDEVLAVGDMAFQKKCLDKMRSATKREGRTVLYVSHNMNTIRRLCDRCIVMEHGKIIFTGDVEEAIEVYMNTGGRLSLINDCSSKRERTDIDGAIHIDTITFLDRDEIPLYKEGEKIRLKVDYTCSEDQENMAFRLTIHSADGIRAGMATTKPEISSKKGSNCVIITIPLDWLAPGKYIADFVSYSVNEYGHNQLHDVVNEAVAFERQMGLDENNRMEWHHSWWGYVMFPEMSVQIIEEQK